MGGLTGGNGENRGWGLEVGEASRAVALRRRGAGGGTLDGVGARVAVLGSHAEDRSSGSLKGIRLGVAIKGVGAAECHTYAHA